MCKIQSHTWDGSKPSCIQWDTSSLAYSTHLIDDDDDDDDHDDDDDDHDDDDDDDDGDDHDHDDVLVVWKPRTEVVKVDVRVNEEESETLHTSHLTPHTSHITPHTSHTTPHT